MHVARPRHFAATAVLAGIVALAAAPLALAKPHDEAAHKGLSDNIPDRLSKKQSELRKKGLEKVLKGEAKAVGKNKVVQVAKGQFVELAREGEDSIFTIVAEFGPTNSPFGVLQSGIPGPVRNAIPEPDRSKDNTTIWAPDFSPAYYKNMLFSEAPGAISMRNFYIEQSSGRYAVNGDVTEWVTVPYNAAHYGRDYCGSIVCQQSWRFVQDAANAWYDAQVAAGKTVDQINTYLSKFDKWDRYDQDGDGNFNESDGYIDHFQVVHAGEGQETGGGAQGSDAIWRDPRALAEWLMPNDFEARVGHVFRFHVDPMPGFSGVSECRVLEVEAPRRLTYTWTVLPKDSLATPPPPMIVRWELTPERGGTRLVLEQTGLEALSWWWRLSMNTGWSRMMKKLLPKVAANVVDGEFTPGAVTRRDYGTESVPDGFAK